MTIYFQNLQSIFPDVPRESPSVDNKGDFTASWELYFGTLSQALQDNFKNEGIVFPSLSATNMTQIQGLYTSYVGGSYNTLASNLIDISGQTVFDSTTMVSNQFVIAEDGSGNVTLAEWVPFQMTLQNTGNPDLTIAGLLYWFCYDTTNGALYICTTSGAAGTARWMQLTAGTGGGVLSVSGTLNRITSTGGANPIIDIAATYVGQTSITTLGTISSGTWNGTIISPTYGGTGVNNGTNTVTLGGSFSMVGSYTFAGTLIGNTAITYPTSGTIATTSQLPTPSALTEVNDTNVTLTLGGSPSTALLAATSITAGWTGTLSGARGGTGVANTGLTINLGSGSSGYVLTSDSSGNAIWAANPGAGSITTLTGDSGSATASAGAITVSGGVTGLTTSGASHTLSLTGILNLAHGGLNANLTASVGGIFYSTASAGAILAGTATANLPLLSGASSSPAWGAYAISLGGALTTAGALTTVGAYGATFTFINTTSVTYPTSGTLATTSQLPTPAALTSANDTNVTLTLGGSPSTALLQAASITAGWTGNLAVGRGGTGNTTFTAYSVICAGTTATGSFQNVSGVGTSNQVLVSNGASALPTWQSVPGLSPAALTSANDTNVTLTLGGTPSTALLQASSITAGWTGTLSGTRGGTGVNNGSSTITIGGNITFSGAYTFIGTLTANTAITYPISGTLATTVQIPLVWAANSNSSITAAVGNAYILTSGSATTVTLPATFAVGAQVGVSGQGAAWTLALGASTNIKAFGNTYTTSLASTDNYDSVVLLAVVANTTWTIIEMTSKGLTAS